MNETTDPRVRAVLLLERCTCPIDIDTIGYEVGGRDQAEAALDKLIAFAIVEDRRGWYSLTPTTRRALQAVSDALVREQSWDIEQFRLAVAAWCARMMTPGRQSETQIRKKHLERCAAHNAKARKAKADAKAAANATSAHDLGLEHRAGYRR
jgi:hypothetical protein